MGDGAAEWLVEAAATGTPRIRAKMADAVALAKLHGSGALDQRWAPRRWPGGSPRATWPRSWPTSRLAPPVPPSLGDPQR
jgi:hypothetical protein